MFKRIFKVNPKERITIEEIKDHPWFKLQNQSIDERVLIQSDSLSLDTSALDHVERIFQNKHTKEEVEKFISKNVHNNVTTT